MAYELVQSRNTQFAIDWSVVRQLVRSYYTSAWQLDLGRETTLSESHWYNPFSWSMPDVAHIEVDWGLVRSYADADADNDVARMRRRAATDAAGVAWQLDELIDLTARNKESFTDWMGTVQTRNMESIDKAVDDYDSNIEIAKFVRDASAEGLMIGASVMSGGAATAALGGASFFKGYCKFQDTTNDHALEAAVLEGVGSFAFAYVKLGKKLSFKEDMVLAFVQAPYKTGTELVAGKSVSDAFVSGSVKLVAPTVDRLFKIGPAKTLFDKVAVPVVITVKAKEGIKNVTSDLLTKSATKSVEKTLESRGKQALEDSPATNPRQSGRIVSDATLSNKLLLYLAFVNMEKGIGRGW